LTSNEISLQHTSSRLVLLTMHFPKLRILWCSSPSQTAEMFEELKSGLPQPNVDEAMSIKSDQILENDEHKYNPILRVRALFIYCIIFFCFCFCAFLYYLLNNYIKDMLLKIPGINSKNVIYLLSRVKDFGELCEKSEQELNEILENSKSAKIVYEFLNKSLKKAADSIGQLDFDNIDDFGAEEKAASKATNNKKHAAGAGSGAASTYRSKKKNKK
jgi:DNA excision repair protein ERCC-4